MQEETAAPDVCSPLLVTIPITECFSLRYTLRYAEYATTWILTNSPGLLHSHATCFIQLQRGDFVKIHLVALNNSGTGQRTYVSKCDAGAQHQITPEFVCFSS